MIRKSLSPNQRNAIFLRDGVKCKRCGSRENLCLDHVIPWIKGGKCEASNLQVLCRKCNFKKRSEDGVCGGVPRQPLCEGSRAPYYRAYRARKRAELLQEPSFSEGGEDPDPGRHQ